MAVPAAAFTLSGEAKIYEKPADSGNIVGRAFCPTCGSAVYSLNSGNNDLVFLRASSLDDLEVFKPQLVVYAAKAASWDQLDPSLPAFDAMLDVELMTRSGCPIATTLDHERPLVAHEIEGNGDRTARSGHEL